MKKVLTLAVALMITLSAVYAGCGKKVNNTGKLKSFKAESKQIIVVEGGKNIKLKLTPGTKFFASEGGKEVKAADLVGKSVKVVSEHKKVDSITGA